MAVATPHTSRMAKKNPNADNQPAGDRHKDSHPVRVRRVLADQLKILAERNVTTVPDEVNRAVRELLEREGLWPPKPSPD